MHRRAPTSDKNYKNKAQQNVFLSFVMLQFGMDQENPTWLDFGQLGQDVVGAHNVLELSNLQTIKFGRMQ